MSEREHTLTDDCWCEPEVIVLCGCKQAPWLPPCKHKGGDR